VSDSYQERQMTKLVSAAAALKAERQRDMAKATREYEKEQDARRANMLRLRGLRLLRECAQAEAEAATQQTGKKPTSAAPKNVT
jgi:hypothetical protein